jgi:acyl-CoA thioester hydrolase
MGMADAGVAALDLAVRFAETDLMGVVHHSAYVVWLEAGRVEWMTAAGIPYAELAAAGNHFAVTKLNVDYRASARFGEVVRVETRVARLRSRQVEFAYAVRNAATGELLATGTSEHVCVDLAGRVAKIPAHVIERLSIGAANLTLP